MKLKDLNNKIPETEYEFSIDLEGEVTKTKYTGNFKGLIRTNKMESSIRRKESMLNTGLESEANKKLLGLPYQPILDTHERIAWLSVVLVDCPKWLRDCNYGEDLYGDLNILKYIHDKIIEAEDAWFEKIWGKSKK